MRPTLTEDERIDLARPTAGYIRTLDGWRAIAIFGVLLDHALGGMTTRISEATLESLGEQGVDLFFAISGLLICSRLLSEHKDTGEISLKNFYLRRVFRIQPAAMTYLGFVAVLALGGWLHPSWGAMLSAVFSWRNFYSTFGGHPTGDDHYTSHFWSLSVEEHFYLILPILLVVAWKRRTMVLGIASALLFCWPYVAAHFGLLPTDGPVSWRTDLTLRSLFIPALLACLLTIDYVRTWIAKFTQHYICLGVVVLACAVSTYTGGHLMGPLTCLGFPLVVVSTVLHPEGWIGRVLEAAPLAYIGRISYSIYLWQQFFIAPPVWWVQRAPWNIVGLFVVAVLSYYVVEKPIIRIGHRLTRRRPALATAG